jgi:hypothetical protein
MPPYPKSSEDAQGPAPFQARRDAVLVGVDVRRAVVTVETCGFPSSSIHQLGSLPLSGKPSPRGFCVVERVRGGRDRMFVVEGRRRAIRGECKNLKCNVSHLFLLAWRVSPFVLPLHYVKHAGMSVRRGRRPSPSTSSRRGNGVPTVSMSEGGGLGTFSTPPSASLRRWWGASFLWGRFPRGQNDLGQRIHCIHDLEEVTCGVFARYPP